MEPCGNRACTSWEQRQLPITLLVNIFLPLHLFYCIQNDYCFALKRPWPFWTQNGVTRSHSSKVKRELICELSPIPGFAPCSLKDKSLFQINPDCFSNTLAFGLPCWTVFWHNPDSLPTAMKKSFLTSEVNSLNEALDFLSWEQEKLFRWG